MRDRVRLQTEPLDDPYGFCVRAVEGCSHRAVLRFNDRPLCLADFSLAWDRTWFDSTIPAIVHRLTEGAWAELREENAAADRHYEAERREQERVS